MAKCLVKGQKEVDDKQKRSKLTGLVLRKRHFKYFSSLDDSAPTKSAVEKCPESVLQSGRPERWIFRRAIMLYRLSGLESRNLPGSKPLTWMDLPRIQSLPPGTMDFVTITHVESPSSFYTVWKKKIDYRLDNRMWRLNFLPFTSGTEALHGISVALTIYYKTYFQPEDDKGQPRIFEVMDLVMVRFLSSSSEEDAEFLKSATDKVGRGDDHDFYEAYQMRRGVIMEVQYDNEENCLYLVYLLDFGCRVTASGNAIYPLPYPFHSIAPLAIRCGLVGISSCGPVWFEGATFIFKKNVEKFELKQSKPVLSAEVCSAIPGQWNPSRVVFVNLRPHQRNCQGQSKSARKINSFTDFLMRKNLGIYWNPFPSRPKLIGGNHASSEQNICMKDALLLQPPYGRIFQLLSLATVMREIYRLLSLRQGTVLCDPDLKCRVVLQIEMESLTRPAKMTNMF